MNKLKRLLKNRFFWGYFFCIVLLDVRLSFGEKERSEVSLEIKKYRRGEYFVIEKEIVEEEKRDIIVLRDIKNKQDTVFVLKDFGIGSTISRFLDLFQNFLLMEDASWNMRELKIYDILSGKEVLDCYYTDPITYIRKDSISIWIYDSLMEPVRCPEYNKLKEEGLKSVVFVEHYFDLKRLRLFKTENWKCEVWE